MQVTEVMNFAGNKKILRMKNKIYLMIFLFGFSYAQALQPLTDSTVLPATTKKSSTSVALRVHSIGIFTYMGKVVNYNPASDIFFSYISRSGWGVSAFKVVDLRDIHSHNNFAFALLTKSFHIGKRLTLAPSIGAALEQQHKFADHGSDMLAMLTTTFKLNQHWAIEYNALFANLIVERTETDWINRLKLMYSKGHLDVTGFLWHNNNVMDDGHYLSSGASIFYNRMKLGKKVWLGAGMTGLLTTVQSDPEKPHYKKGLQFTTSLTIK
jgi:hypothetical protein